MGQETVAKEKSRGWVAAGIALALDHDDLSSSGKEPNLESDHFIGGGSLSPRELSKLCVLD